MKQLKTLEKERLISSKSYGLAKDVLWQIIPHPLIKQLDYTPPALIHSLFYDHEIVRQNVFATLYLTNLLQEWTPEYPILHNRSDAKIWLADTLFYLEIEMGTQGKQKLMDKILAYQAYFRQTNEDFWLIFLVPDEETQNRLLDMFKETRVPYLTGLQTAFASDPLNTPLLMRHKQWTIIDILKKNLVPNTL